MAIGRRTDEPRLHFRSMYAVESSVQSVPFRRIALLRSIMQAIQNHFWQNYFDWLMEHLGPLPSDFSIGSKLRTPSGVVRACLDSSDGNEPHARVIAPD